MTVFSAGFHEFGHAAACRYGGATPGAMGTGLYLVWPAFYTDVTDSYRLGRAGRLRIDLGGLYFNAIVAVAMFVVWLVTGWDALLLILATQLLQMVRQLAPMVRFDGYHVLADLTGVPDLCHRIGPTLRGLLPRPGTTPRPRRSSRGPGPWSPPGCSSIVPLLLFTLVLMVLALPRVVGTAWGSLRQAGARADRRLGWRRCVGVAVRVLSIVAVSLPVLGVAVRPRPARRAGRLALAGTRDGPVGGRSPRPRSPWWPGWRGPGGPTPTAIARSSPTSAARSSTGLPGEASSADPPASRTADREGQRAVWPPRRRRRGGHPQLALVLVPRSPRRPALTERPGLGLPVQPPRPPAAGDNQALAVNTTDGSTTYDVAFALVWADGTSVTNSNSAYAFASCGSARPSPWPSRSSSSPVTRMSPYPRTSPARSTTPASSASPTPWRSSSSSPSRASSPDDPTAARHAVAADQHLCHHRPGPSPRRDPHPAAGLPEPDPGAGQGSGHTGTRRQQHRAPPPARGRRRRPPARPGSHRRPRESLTPPPTPTGTAPGSSAAPTTATAGPTSEPSAEPSSSASATESSAPEPSGSAVRRRSPQRPSRAATPAPHPDRSGASGRASLGGGDARGRASRRWWRACRTPRRTWARPSPSWH